MTRNILLAVLATTVAAQSQIYMGANAGYQGSKFNAKTDKVQSDPSNAISTERHELLNARKNAFVGGLFVGYNHAINDQWTVGAELSFDYSGAEIKKDVTLTQANIDAEHEGTMFVGVATTATMRTKIKSGFGIGFMPNVKMKVSDMMDAGFGLKINMTQFTMHTENVDEITNWKKDTKKFMFGVEPTLFANFKVSHNVSVRGSVGYAVYKAASSNDRTVHPDTNLQIRNNVNALNAKIGVIYTF